MMRNRLYTSGRSRFSGTGPGGKKLFEIIFLAINYLNLNLLPIADYFSGLNKSLSLDITILLIIPVLIFISFAIRKYDIVQR